MADTDTSNKRAAAEESIRDMRADFQTGKDGEEGEKKKSFMKPLLLIAALLVVGGAAAGAWMFLQQAPEEEVEIAEPEPVVYEKVYIQSEPVHISFEMRGGRQHRLIVYFTLEVLERDANVADVQRALPRLQEAYWRSLNAEPFAGAERGEIELTKVKERLRAESERMLGPDIVNDVLIRDARMIRG